MFFTMEKIKLYLSEFSDVVNLKMINPEVELDINDLFEIGYFLDELEFLNKNKKEKEFQKLIDNYSSLLNKINSICRKSTELDVMNSSKITITPENDLTKDSSKSKGYDKLNTSKLNNSKINNSKIL